MKNLFSFLTPKKSVDDDLLIFTNKVKALEQSHGKKIGELEVYMCKLQRDVYKLQQDVIEFLKNIISEHKEAANLNSSLNRSIQDAVKTISRLQDSAEVNSRYEKTISVLREQIKQKDEIIFDMKKANSKDVLIKNAHPNESLKAQKQRENIYEQVTKNDKALIKKKPHKK